MLRAIERSETKGHKGCKTLVSLAIIIRWAYVLHLNVEGETLNPLVYTYAFCDYLVPWEKGLFDLSSLLYGFMIEHLLSPKSHYMYFI